MRGRGRGDHRDFPPPPKGEGEVCECLFETGNEGGPGGEERKERWCELHILLYFLEKGERRGRGMKYKAFKLRRRVKRREEEKEGEKRSQSATHLLRTFLYSSLKKQKRRGGKRRRKMKESFTAKL